MKDNKKTLSGVKKSHQDLKNLINEYYNPLISEQVVEHKASKSKIAM